MKKILILTGFALVLSAPAAALAGHHIGHETRGAEEQLKSETAKDPVCGMDVTVKGAKYACEYKGNKYYFCMKEDMEKFKKDPGKYLKK